MYERILVPVDGSATARSGLDEAIRLARLTGARLRLMHVVDMQSFATAPGAYSTPCEELVGMLTRNGQAVLSEAEQVVRAAGVACDTVLHENLSERVCDLVVDEATNWHADLVVIGTHGRRRIGRWLLGSDAEQVLRLSRVPVLLVRPPAVEATHRALAPAA